MSIRSLALLKSQEPAKPVGASDPAVTPPLVLRAHLFKSLLLNPPAVGE